MVEVTAPQNGLFVSIPDIVTKCRAPFPWKSRDNLLVVVTAVLEYDKSGS